MEGYVKGKGPKHCHGVLKDMLHVGKQTNKQKNVNAFMWIWAEIFNHRVLRQVPWLICTFSESGIAEIHKAHCTVGWIWMDTSIKMALQK